MKFCLGVSPTGRFTTLIPLSIILFLTALKEIYEDIMRLVQDRDVNQRKVQVLTKERSDSIDDYKLVTLKKGYIYISTHTKRGSRRVAVNLAVAFYLPTNFPK